MTPEREASVRDFELLSGADGCFTSDLSWSVNLDLGDPGRKAQDYIAALMGSRREDPRGKECLNSNAEQGESCGEGSHDSSGEGTGRSSCPATKLPVDDWRASNEDWTRFRRRRRTGPALAQAVAKATYLKY